jgi:hypothetical protein
MINQLVVTSTMAIVGTITSICEKSGFVLIDGKETMLHPCQLIPCLDLFGEFAEQGLPESFWQIEPKQVAA